MPLDDPTNHFQCTMDVQCCKRVFAKVLTRVNTSIYVEFYKDTLFIIVARAPERELTCFSLSHTVVCSLMNFMSGFKISM